MVALLVEVERIDFANNMASLIHGHAHPAIVAAVSEQLEKGTAFTLATEIEVRYAEHIISRGEHFEMLRFVNSGTEAIMGSVYWPEGGDERNPMKREVATEKLEDLSFTAAMNQRYHQAEWSNHRDWDQRVRIIVGLGAVASALLSALSFYVVSFSAASAIVSLITLVFAVILNVVPSGDRVTASRDIYRRWSDLREDVDSLALRIGAGKTQAVSDDESARIDELEARKNRINALEGAPDHEKLDEAFAAEWLARTGEHFERPERPRERPVALPGRAQASPPGATFGA